MMQEFIPTDDAFC